MKADLALWASDFQFVNVAARRKPCLRQVPTRLDAPMGSGPPDELPSVVALPRWAARTSAGVMQDSLMECAKEFAEWAVVTPVRSRDSTRSILDAGLPGGQDRRHGCVGDERRYRS